MIDSVLIILECIEKTKLTVSFDSAIGNPRVCAIITITEECKTCCNQMSPWKTLCLCNSDMTMELIDRNTNFES